MLHACIFERIEHSIGIFTKNKEITNYAIKQVCDSGELHSYKHYKTSSITV